jgi:hypothetical protein
MERKDRRGGARVLNLKRMFDDLVRLEIDLWDAVDGRLRAEAGLPLTHFEPMAVMDRLGACRVYDIAAELSITTGGVSSSRLDRLSSGLGRLRP